MNSPHLTVDALPARFPPGIRVGFDLVQISRIAASVRQFGDRFTQRLFTANELDYAHRSEGLCFERLAARFAAKEATIKALALAEQGIGWREIEVCKLHDGSCHIALHGHAAMLASHMGITQMALSLSHDGDYAGAIVTVLCHTPESLT
jgi:holo-[acyl-carrier protein] synthase